jgi:NitT/TauT family transport system permease protein
VTVIGHDSEERIVSAAVSVRPDIRPTGRSEWLRQFFARPAGRIAGQIAIVVLLLTIWQTGSGEFLPRVWVSSPSAIFSRLVSWFADGSIWYHLAATLTAAAGGYVLGSLSGIASGLLLGLFPRLEQILSPFVTAFYALPKVALAPLFVIFLGIGIESKIALVAVTVYFLLLYNTLDGLHDIERSWATAYRIMGARREEIIRHVLLPGIMPWIFSGLRISVRYAFTAAVFGELIAGNRGIGFLIENAAGKFNSAGIFAGVFLLVICSVAATQIIAQAEKVVLHWRTS